MIDDRLAILREFGYSERKIRGYESRLPESFLEEMAGVETRREAKDVIRRHLQESKATIDVEEEVTETDMDDA